MRCAAAASRSIFPERCAHQRTLPIADVWDNFGFDPATGNAMITAAGITARKYGVERAETDEIVTGLQLSHTSGKAVSLIERQVQVLRHQTETLNSRLVELVNVARDNDRLSSRMHQMTVDLLQAGSLVAPDRLRFDFSWGDRVAREQLVEIERQRRRVRRLHRPSGPAVLDGADHVGVDLLHPTTRGTDPGVDARDPRPADRRRGHAGR